MVPLRPDTLAPTFQEVADRTNSAVQSRRDLGRGARPVYSESKSGAYRAGTFCLSDWPSSSRSPLGTPVGGG